ncbi:response regulator transcription factor [Streptomyces sp. NPDC050548]|uniref:response regulator transcription factor n=1 Tax=Streptomyces sp. NPDC050548 TaxID=3365629 RepID=UPI0037882272
MCATTPELEETDQQILALLYQGLVDAAVARKLGLGHRTVQRRVQNLMELLQVRGRVALGAKAQELGLLPASGSSVGPMGAFGCAE